ncbi:hypothetical protein [Amycolatopsis thermoflava]|uniref:hypothetical protein n=1 Tax=Amycolatopsis thermoflava TaxID=84480 RepID=UPI0003F7EF07|nr:hypothetical protein [Amycolatopsis thermoflava]
MTTHNEHRDELARLVFDSAPREAEGPDWDDSFIIADALLAAGWRKQGAAHPDLGDLMAQTAGMVARVIDQYRDYDAPSHVVSAGIVNWLVSAGVLAEQGAADRAAWRAQLLAELEADERAIEVAVDAEGPQPHPERVAGYHAALERVVEIVQDFTPQGAADDDTPTRSCITSVPAEMPPLWWSPTHGLYTKDAPADWDGIVWHCSKVDPLPEDARRLVRERLADDDTTRLRAELAEAQREAEGWKELADRWERDHQNTVLPYTTKVEAERDDLQARIDAVLALCAAAEKESIWSEHSLTLSVADVRTALTQVSQPQPEPGPEPGDWVTMRLFSDGYTRTSIVEPDGTYTGCGAVASGRGEIVSIQRGSATVSRPQEGQS